MKEINLQIDGKSVKATEGMTVLQAAQNVGIRIPTLCWHEKLEPYGACRMCSVEIEERGKSRVVVSCVYPVEEGLKVKTSSEKLSKVRAMLTELLLARAPGAKEIQGLARQYNVNTVRFEKASAYCIDCGLCVRYCHEIKKANAIGFVGRGTEREVMFVPEIAARTCLSCKECFPLCPTDVLRSNFLLAQALTFSK